MSDQELYHYGVKGMKWGVRRYRNADGSLTPAGKKREAKQQQKELKKFEKKKNKLWVGSYNTATDRFNKDIDAINAKYKNDKFDDTFSTKRGQQYVKEVSAMWKKHYVNALLEDIGPEPINRGKEWVESMPFMNSYDEFIR